MTKYCEGSVVKSSVVGTYQVLCATSWRPPSFPDGRRPGWDVYISNEYPCGSNSDITESLPSKELTESEIQPEAKKMAERTVVLCEGLQVTPHRFSCGSDLWPLLTTVHREKYFNFWKDVTCVFSTCIREWPVSTNNRCPSNFQWNKNWQYVLMDSFFR